MDSTSTHVLIRVARRYCPYSCDKIIFVVQCILSENSSNKMCIAREGSTENRARSSHIYLIGPSLKKTLSIQTAVSLGWIDYSF